MFEDFEWLDTIPHSHFCFQHKLELCSQIFTFTKKSLAPPGDAISYKSYNGCVFAFLEP